MKILMTNNIWVSVNKASALTGLNQNVINKAVEYGYIETIKEHEPDGRDKLNLYDVYKFAEVIHAGSDNRFSNSIKLYPLNTIEHFILYKYIGD